MGAARRRETIIFHMSSDDVTPAVNPISRPSHRSGPGYVANRKAHLEVGSQLQEAAAARWLNFVPSQHRHDTTRSAKSALETLEEHTGSCREHPLRALWAAHRHLQDPSSAIRIASLVLASEALWWLGHFEDARIAAQAAVDADPGSAQARWRLAVALYRQGGLARPGSTWTSFFNRPAGSLPRGHSAARSRSGWHQTTLTQRRPTSRPRQSWTLPNGSAAPDQLLRVPRTD